MQATQSISSNDTICYNMIDQIAKEHLHSNCMTTIRHPVTDSVLQIDTPALRRESDSTSLAAGFQWRRGSTGLLGREGKQDIMSLCLGRVSVAYPAGFATDMALYIQRSRPSGKATIL